MLRQAQRPVGAARQPVGAARQPAGTQRPVAADAATRRAWQAAASVLDPEVPVLTIEDLGVLRDVQVVADESGEARRVTVTITPTYSGCPAMDAIRDDVMLALTAAGFDDVDVRLVLAPAWTTDWMTDAGKRKLVDYGIAPPNGRAAVAGPIRVQLSVRCPRCGSLDTRELARFGSTSCKALYECRACLEPFDHFKVH
uniref:1,2-phenylacetyl-CoA epoxidase subunit PaaD n=1 Tax=Microbacterium chionoecetis TaxID=3153754 RepID=UPI003F50103C